MTKDISAIREEFKKLVIMGCHPECKTHEDALGKELGIGCEISTESGQRKIMTGIEKDGIHARCGAHVCPIKWLRGGDYGFKIIGLPITIGRVMQAVAVAGVQIDNAYFTDGVDLLLSVAKKRKNEEYHDTWSFSWQLTKDGKECTDDDQTDEAIKELYYRLSLK